MKSVYQCYWTPETKPQFTNSSTIRYDVIGEGFIHGDILSSTKVIVNTRILG